MTSAAHNSSSKKYNWYIINVYSGSEQNVVDQLKAKLELKGMSDLVQEILIPTENIIEFSGSKKVTKTVNCLPGYILVKMCMNNDLWHVIKSVPRVSGFLGATNVPSIVSEEEVQRMMAYSQKSTQSPTTNHKFEIGEPVKIISGPFESFSGFIDEIDGDRIKVSIVVFGGRQTTVVLERNEITLA